MPLYQVDLNTLESFSFLFKSLWSADIVRKPRINIVDTIIFQDGEPIQWLFTSDKTGEVLKKKQERLATSSELVRVIKNRSRALRGFKELKLKSKIATVWYLESGRKISSYLVDEAELTALLHNHLAEILCIQVFMGGYYLKGNGIFEHRMFLQTDGTSKHETFEMIDPITSQPQSMFTNNCEKLAITEQQHSIATALCKYLNKHINFMTSANVSQIVLQVVFNSSWVPYLVSSRKVMLEDAPEEFLRRREELIFPAGRAPQLPCFNPNSLLLPMTWTEYSLPKKFGNRASAPGDGVGGGGGGGGNGTERRGKVKQHDLQPHSHVQPREYSQPGAQPLYLDLADGIDGAAGDAGDVGGVECGPPTRVSVLTTDSGILALERGGADKNGLGRRGFEEHVGVHIDHLDRASQDGQTTDGTTQNMNRANTWAGEVEDAVPFSPSVPRSTTRGSVRQMQTRRRSNAQAAPCSAPAAPNAAAVVATARATGADTIRLKSGPSPGHFSKPAGPAVGGGGGQVLRVPMPDLSRGATPGDLGQEILYAGVDLAAASSEAAAVVARTKPKPKPKKVAERLTAAQASSPYALYRPASASSLATLRALSRRNNQAVDDLQLRGGAASFSAASLLRDLDAAPQHQGEKAEKGEMDSTRSNPAASERDQLDLEELLDGDAVTGRFSTAVSEDGLDPDGEAEGLTAEELRAVRATSEAVGSFYRDGPGERDEHGGVRRFETHTEASAFRTSFYSSRIRDDHFLMKEHEKVLGNRRPISAPHPQPHFAASSASPSASVGRTLHSRIAGQDLFSTAASAAATAVSAAATAATAAASSAKFSSSYKFLAPELQPPPANGAGGGDVEGRDGKFVFSRQLPPADKRGFSFNKALPLSSCKCFGSYCAFGRRAMAAAAGVLPAETRTGTGTGTGGNGAARVEESSFEHAHKIAYKSILLAKAETRFLDGAALDDNIESLLDQINLTKITSEQLYTYFVRRHLNRVALRCQEEARRISFNGEQSPFALWADLNAVYRRLVYADALARVHPSRFYYTVPLCEMCYKIYTFMDSQRELIVLKQTEGQTQGQDQRAAQAAAKAEHTLTARVNDAQRSRSAHSRQASQLQEHIRKSRSGNYVGATEQERQDATGNQRMQQRPHSAGAISSHRSSQQQHQHQQHHQYQVEGFEEHKYAADAGEGGTGVRTRMGTSPPRQGNASSSLSKQQQAQQRRPRNVLDDNALDQTNDRGIGSRGPTHRISHHHLTKGKASISSWVRLFARSGGSGGDRGTSASSEEQYERYGAAPGDLFDWDTQQDAPTYLRPTSSSRSGSRNGSKNRPAGATATASDGVTSRNKAARLQDKRSTSPGTLTDQQQQHQHQHHHQQQQVRPHSAQDFRPRASGSGSKTPCPHTHARGEDKPRRVTVTGGEQDLNAERRPQSADAVNRGVTWHNNAHQHPRVRSNISAQAPQYYQQQQQQQQRQQQSQSQFGGAEAVLLSGFQQHITAALVAPCGTGNGPPVRPRDEVGAQVSAAYAYASLPFMAAPHFPTAQPHPQASADTEDGLDSAAAMGGDEGGADSAGAVRVRIPEESMMHPSHRQRLHRLQQQHHHPHHQHHQHSRARVAPNTSPVALSMYRSGALSSGGGDVEEDSGMSPLPAGLQRRPHMQPGGLLAQREGRMEALVEGSVEDRSTQLSSRSKPPDAHSSGGGGGGGGNLLPLVEPVLEGPDDSSGGGGGGNLLPLVEPVLEGPDENASQATAGQGQALDTRQVVAAAHYVADTAAATMATLPELDVSESHESGSCALPGSSGLRSSIEASPMSPPTYEHFRATDAPPLREPSGEPRDAEDSAGQTALSSTTIGGIAVSLSVRDASSAAAAATTTSTTGYASPAPFVPRLSLDTAGDRIVGAASPGTSQGGPGSLSPMRAPSSSPYGGSPLLPFTDSPAAKGESTGSLKHTPQPAHAFQAGAGTGALGTPSSMSPMGIELSGSLSPFPDMSISLSAPAAPGYAHGH